MVDYRVKCRELSSKQAETPCKKGIMLNEICKNANYKEVFAMKWEELPGAYEWDRRLAYFLDPANQADISKEDLQDALAILAARYCDEFYNLRFLECYVEEELGTAKLESAIEASAQSDGVLDRSAVVMNETNVEDRMITALEFINRITEEYGDDDDEEDF